MISEEADGSELAVALILASARGTTMTMWNDDDLAIELHEHSLAKEEYQQWVGSYTIDMSIKLKDASHFHMHDASQGASLCGQSMCQTVGPTGSLSSLVYTIL